MSEKIIQQLLASKEPAVQLKTYIQLLDFKYDAKEVIKVSKTLKEKSLIVKNLLEYTSGEQSKHFHPYTKWQGFHWNLAQLADIKYPFGDDIPAINLERELRWLAGRPPWAPKLNINGRSRFCASQEGNCLYAMTSLNLKDSRLDALAERLITAQWPDGGWNCDKNPDASKSSYHESLIPTRGLNLYSKMKNDQKVKNCVEKACELFLKRKLYQKQSDNSVINEKWLVLCYPSYWHYNILTALKVLAECGKILDTRTNDALNIIELKQLPDGGFPAEDKYYQNGNQNKGYFSPCDWGGVGKKKMNEWVTIDALFVLKKAKRIEITW